jgi:hypothetical protein
VDAPLECHGRIDCNHIQGRVMSPIASRLVLAQRRRHGHGPAEPLAGITAVTNQVGARRARGGVSGAGSGPVGRDERRASRRPTLPTPLVCPYCSMPRGGSGRLRGRGRTRTRPGAPSHQRRQRGITAWAASDGKGTVVPACRIHRRAPQGPKSACIAKSPPPSRSPPIRPARHSRASPTSVVFLILASAAT